MKRYAKIATSASLLEELEMIRRANDATRFEPVAPPADDLADLIADYWRRLDAEILAANAREYATERAIREAEAEAEEKADQIEARALRRRTRVFGVSALLAAIPRGESDLSHSKESPH